jgi:hypothetical protein
LSAEKKYVFTAGDQELPLSEKTQLVNVFYYQKFEILENEGLLRFPFRVVFSRQGVSFLYFDPEARRDEELFFFEYNAHDYPAILSDILQCHVEPVNDGLLSLRQKWGWKGKQFDTILAGRALFLSFLETLMQPDKESVFSRSLYFRRARNTFLSNSFIKGIYLKNQFYSAVIAEQEEPLMISKIEEAAEKWLRFIINPEHAKYFTKTLSPHDTWYMNEEKELRKALLEYKRHELKRDLSDDVTQFFLDRSAVFRALIFQFQQRWQRERVKVGFTLVVFLCCLSFFVVYPLMTSDKAGWLSTLLLVVMGVAFSAGVAIFIASLCRLFTFNLLLPKMQLAIVTSLLGLLSSVDYFKMGFDLELKGKMGYITLVVALVALTYIYYITKKHTGIAHKVNVPWVDSLHIAGKTAAVFFLSYAFSLFVSFAGINLVAEQYITNTDFIEDHSVRKNIFELDSTQKSAEYFYNNIGTLHVKAFKNCKEMRGGKLVHLFNFSGIGRMIMFPGFLMVTGLFSLFGGILFGLLFENKRISEPI